MRVIVIGGGIGGLAAALALRRAGADVRVLEQAHEIAEVGAGLQVSPNGLRVLEALGVASGLEAAAVRARAVSLRNFARGREVLRLDLTRLGADQRYLFVHRADLVGALCAAAEAAGVVLETGRTVVSATAEGLVTLAGGAQNEADLVIGADGVRSVVRPVLDGGTTPFFTGQVAWRAVVPNDVGQGPEARVYMGPGRHLVCYPLRDGKALNLVAVQERDAWAAEGWSHRDDAKNLRAAFADFGGDAARVLGHVEAPGLWGLFRHPVAGRWQAGRLALLGDAAHPTLPFLAQGANMALEDAWVLARCLGGFPIAEALPRYQAARRDRVVRVIEAANGNARKYHLRHPLVRRSAHLGLSVLGRLAPGRMLGQFDWLYRHDVTTEPV